jgi:hypothetical protein
VGRAPIAAGDRAVLKGVPMALLKRRALKRCEQLIRPIAERGELVQDFDVGWLGRSKVDFIATDRRLLIVPLAGGGVTDIRYDDVSSALWFPMGYKTWTLQITERAGTVVCLDIRAPGDLGFDLSRRFRDRS